MLFADKAWIDEVEYVGEKEAKEGGIEYDEWE